ncbi:MAG: hypothetical protein KGV56_00105 [Gammaproteobacteria bacterium]|nr:hypothetical protein [Gammaproteobacteria bacterium]
MENDTINTYTEQQEKIAEKAIEISKSLREQGFDPLAVFYTGVVLIGAKDYTQRVVTVK